ncbi:MAG TPA: VanZ family protein [Blastocatellia bacterium]|nr:VanZ family protein [Blastocatellia bacterium]
MSTRLVTAGSGILGRAIKYWLPVFVMVGLMYYASTDVLSGENTRGAIEKFLSSLGLQVTWHTLARINYWLRKTAHFTEYALLCWLLFRAFRADSPYRWRFRWAVFSLVICACWALLDELHQTFTRTRGGSINDSILDSVGALVSLAAIGVSAAVRRNKTRYS